MVSRVLGRVVISVLVVVLAPGCATINSTVVDKDEPTRVAEERAAPTGTPSVTGSVAVKQAALELSFGSTSKCEVKTNHFVRRHRDTQRTLSGGAMTLTLGTAVALLGLGALSYFDAPGIAASTQSNSGPVSPATVQVTGIVLMGLAVVPLIIAVVDAFRSIDSHEDLGEVIATTDTRTEDCDRKPVAGEVVTPATEGLGTARTDSGGRVLLSFLPVPLAQLPTRSLRVSVGHQAVDVPLADAEAASLRVAVLADGTSVASQEAKRKHERECADAVRAASTQQVASEEDEAAGARRWVAAREACGASMPPGADEAKSRFDQAVARNVEVRAMRKCNAAFKLAEQELEGASRQEAGTAIDAADSACEGKGTAGLRSRLAALIQRDQAAALIAGAREAYLTRLMAGALEEARTLVAQNKAICTPLDRTIQDATLTALVNTATPVLNGGDTSPRGARALCVARTLYIACVGRDSWRELTKGLADKVAASDPLRVGGLVTQLNAGSCGGTK